MYWGPCKQRRGSSLKNPKLPESSQWSPFLERWGRGVVSCLNILVSEPLLWRSGHGQLTVPLSISWVLVSVLTRKGRSWGTTYPPRSSPGWVRAQPAVPSGPGPQTLLSRHRWGSRASNPTGPQAPQAGHVVGGVGAGPEDGIPGGRCCKEVAEAGKGSLPPQGRGLASGGHSEGSRGHQDTAPHVAWTPRSPLVWGWTNWSTLGGRPGRRLPHCPP